MVKSILIFLFIVIAISGAFALPQEGRNKLYHVDLRDVSKFHETAAFKRLANRIIRTFKGNFRTLLVPSDVAYTEEGAHNITSGRGIISEHHTNTIYGLEVYNIEEHGAVSEVFVQVLFHSAAEGGHFIRRYQFQYANRDFHAREVQIIDQTPLSDINFKVDISLTQHKLILEGRGVRNRQFQIKKVYPVAVGALDSMGDNQADYSSLTPLFKQHILSRGATQYAKTQPAIFRAMPFLRIRLSEELSNIIQDNFYPQALRERSGIALHRIMNETLHRGFDSHGCVRLQIKDLYEIYFILFRQNSSSMPINIHRFMSDTADSPYPMYADIAGTTKRVIYRTYERNSSSLQINGPVTRGKRVQVRLNRRLHRGVIYSVNREQVVVKLLEGNGSSELEVVDVSTIYSERGLNRSVRSFMNFIQTDPDMITNERQMLQWLYIGNTPAEILSLARD